MKGTTDKSLPPFPNPAAHLEFYKLFKRESDEFDNDFIKKYDDEANTTLIFAGLFSAVTSAFIIDVQSQLQPDYTQMSFALLTIIANASLGKIPTGTDVAFPQWNGPDPAIVHVLTILYSSLAASLLAALVAMLGKQWLTRFAQLEIHGSIADRSRHRARKFHGMVTWHFDFVMESLPLMLQAALFLLGYALSNYLFFINKAVSGVIIGFTTFGLLFYLLIVSAATLSYTCPFQTPPSLIIRYMVRFDDENWKYLQRLRRWFETTLSPKRKLRRLRLGALPQLGYPGTLDGNETDDPIVFAMAGSSDQQPPLFVKQAEGDSYAFDSNCIMQVFKISTDADVIQANMKLILEITWHAGIRVTPLERVHDAMLECFDRSAGCLAVIPKLRNQAYLSARALLHLTIQRQCIGHKSDEAVFESISSQHPIIGSTRYEEDSDLESTLGIIDRLFGGYGEIHWKTFSFSVPHQAWMGHILLYRAWDVLGKDEPLPDDVKEFVLYSLRLEPPPPAPIVTDCLFIIGLALGIRPHIDDLLVIDKSDKQDQQLDRIYKKLVETFENPTATTEEIDRALGTLELTAPLSENDIATRSYHIFHVVMQAPLSENYTQEKKWEASRLAMRGAYKWDKFLPWVEDPEDILTFLDYHFDLATRSGEDHDEPIQNALRALAYASSPDTIEALEHFDPTTPSFVRGICYVYRDNKPFQLRKAALFFLPLIGHRWFNNANQIMEPDQMRRLCVNWASAVDGIEHTDPVQKAVLAVLFDMMNSPHWRPHIVTEKWKLLEYHMAVPDDSQPLKRCLNNPELSEAISQGGNPTATVLWLAILWLRYAELIPEVRRQLVEITRYVAGGARRADLDMYLSVLNVELEKAENALDLHNTWPVDPLYVVLGAKIDNLKQAKAALLPLREVDVVSV